ncbi:MAG: ATP-dependent Clp protease adaptor ClpS [Bacteroidales bacterium]|nr:ATP-dependent Clp protease adaptor ClpS [Bacteroidales bacterium]
MKENQNIKKPSKKEDFGINKDRYLILYNDNTNTFDYVISCLIEVCDHDIIQAEQCAFITHHKGKCDIKKGDYKSLKPMRITLIDKGLKVTID